MLDDWDGRMVESVLSWSDRDQCLRVEQTATNTDLGGLVTFSLNNDGGDTLTVTSSLPCLGLVATRVFRRVKSDTVESEKCRRHSVL